MSSKKELEQQVADLQAQNEQLKTAQTEKSSKGKQQAEAALALLQAGPVTLEQLRAINQRYPNDPIYFVRTLLKQSVVTHRAKGGATTYSLPTVTAGTTAPEATPEVTPEVTPAEEVPSEEPTEDPEQEQAPELEGADLVESILEGN